MQEEVTKEAKVRKTKKIDEIVESRKEGEEINELHLQEEVTKEAKVRKTKKIDARVEKRNKKRIVSAQNSCEYILELYKAFDAYDPSGLFCSDHSELDMSFWKEGLGDDLMDNELDISEMDENCSVDKVDEIIVISSYTP